MFNPNIFLRLFAIVLLGSLLSVGTGRAATGTPNQDLAELQQVYRSLHSLRFDFTQVTRTRMRARKGRGTAIFLRTGNNGEKGIMRWNYTEPDPQVILNDGTNLTIYTPKDHQLLVTSAAQLNNDITYSFFSGKKKLADDFIPQPPDSRYLFNAGGVTLHALRLIPRKPHPQIQSVQIWFDNHYLIRHLVLEDPFASITELNFTNIETNTIDGKDSKVVQQILHLNLPPETEILHQ